MNKLNRYNHKALVNYYAKLIYKEIYTEKDIPDGLEDAVLHAVDELKKLPYANTNEK